MSAIVVVSTCDREYLPATLASLDDAGARGFDRWILSDGKALPTERVPAGWTNLPAVGSWGFPSVRNNLWGAFRLAVECEAERLLYFEDDVEACANAVRRMATVAIPDEAAFVTFHDVKELPPDQPDGIRLTKDVWGKDGLGIWGNQAMAVPLRTCRFLAQHDPFSVWKRSLPRHGDRTMEHFVSLSPWSRYAIHIPCLVRHLGEISRAHPGKGLEPRPTSNWRGRDYDAMESTCP